MDLGSLVVGILGIWSLVIIGIIQLVKRDWPEVPSRVLPLAALVLGLAGAVALKLVGELDLGWAMVVISGFATGFASTGVYDIGRAWSNNPSS